MKRHFIYFGFVFLFFVLSLLSTVNVYAQDGQPSPTPTYDPLKEPIVPENPSEYELGRNWYWHYCMPCHGDKGQGLTDEWRAVWEPDHQDCWGKGCHAGERIGDSFAIPTVVPPVVSSAKLARFSSLGILGEYLMTTHPPQNPGWLSGEQYHAIALYIFHENDRPLVESIPTGTAIPTSTLVPVVIPVETTSPGPGFSLYRGLGIVALGVALVFAMLWGLRKLR